MNAATTTISEHVFISINFYTFYFRRVPEDFRRGRSSPAKIWMKCIFLGFSNSNAGHGVDGILQPPLELDIETERI
jgi:hypothetical protein